VRDAAAFTPAFVPGFFRQGPKNALRGMDPAHCEILTTK
jgi:hypothetical protein